MFNFDWTTPGKGYARSYPLAVSCFHHQMTIEMTETSDLSLTMITGHIPHTDAIRFNTYYPSPLSLVPIPKPRSLWFVNTILLLRRWLPSSCSHIPSSSVSPISPPDRPMLNWIFDIFDNQDVGICHIYARTVTAWREPWSIRLHCELWHTLAASFRELYRSQRCTHKSSGGVKTDHGQNAGHTMPQVKGNLCCGQIESWLLYATSTSFIQPYPRNVAWNGYAQL